jgi:RNA polymerase sigma-70 factor (ECF subfamily)
MDAMPILHNMPMEKQVLLCAYADCDHIIRGRVGVFAPIFSMSGGLCGEDGQELSVLWQRREDTVNDKADSVLVEQAARGDGDSFTELCRRYYGPMVAIGHAILGDRHLAEDAAQQAFAKAAVNLPRLRKPEQFGRWVAAICRNEARDLVRMRRALPTVGEPLMEQAERVEGVPPSERGLEARDTVCEAVKKAMSRLSAEAKEVVYLRFYDGLSYEQISAVLGISEQAINGRLRRAKRQLAQYLRRDGFDEVDL